MRRNRYSTKSPNVGTPSRARQRGLHSKPLKRLAGAPGFEPGITGPKPDALPLGYAPLGERQPPHAKPPTLCDSAPDGPSATARRRDCWRPSLY